MQLEIRRTPSDVVRVLCLSHQIFVLRTERDLRLSRFIRWIASAAETTNRPMIWSHKGTRLVCARSLIISGTYRDVN